MLELNKALDQIDAIHGHLARTELYRGIRSALVALTGLVAIAGGFVQSQFVADDSSLEFVIFWVGVALVSFILVAAEVGFHYFFRAGTSQRRATRKVLEQFVPALVAGVAVTAALANYGPTRLIFGAGTPPGVAHIHWLPGLWAILFGLGFFAARPYLPRAIGWVALFYLAAGTGLLLAAANGLRVPWGMGLTFGTGQMLAALVLYWNLERSDHG